MLSLRLCKMAERLLSRFHSQALKNCVWFKPAGRARRRKAPDGYAGTQHSMQAESQGRFVILQPIGTSGPLTPLAIPLQGADAFTKQFQQKAAEAKAIAAKTQQQK